MIVSKCVSELALIILRLSLSWMKTNILEVWNSNVWLIKILCETKGLVVLPDLKSFFFYVRKFFYSSS